MAAYNLGLVPAPKVLAGTTADTFTCTAHHQSIRVTNTVGAADITLTGPDGRAVVVPAGTWGQLHVGWALDPQVGTVQGNGNTYTIEGLSF